MILLDIPALVWYGWVMKSDCQESIYGVWDQLYLGLAFLLILKGFKELVFLLPFKAWEAYFNVQMG